MSYTQRILKLSLVVLYIIFFIKEFSYGVLSVIAICTHELFHVLFLSLNSINFKNFKISILGFRIDLSDNIFVNSQIIMYSIGSIANLMVGAVFFVISLLISTDTFDKFILVNLVIGGFNLLPIFPLDGAFILRSLLFRILKRRYVTMFFSIFISLILSLSMLVLVVNSFLGSFLFNITHLVVIIFTLISTYREYKVLISMFVINKIDNSKRTLLSKGYVKSKVISVHHDTHILDIIKLSKFNKFIIFCVLDEDLEIIDITNHYTILQCYKKFGNIKIGEYYENK